MKKVLTVLIMSAALMAPSVQAEGLAVDASLDYSTEHYVRGLNYAEDALGVGLNGSYDLNWATAFGSVYNVPNIGGDGAVNHTAFGLARGVDLGAFSFTGSLELQHHNAATDSTEVGFGVTFDSLPIIGDYVDVGLTLWDNNDLDYNGIELSVYGTTLDVPFVEGFGLTPFFELGEFDTYDYVKVGGTLGYDLGKVQPYLSTFWLESEDSPFGDEDGWTVQTGLNFSF